MITLSQIDNSINEFLEKYNFIFTYQIDSNKFYNIYYSISNNDYVINDMNNVEITRCGNKLILLDYLNNKL